MSQWQHLIDKHRKALDAAKHIPTWTNEEELAWLAEEASKRQRILEIGTYKGHSAMVLAESTEGTVVCFDMCPDKGVEEEARTNLLPYIHAQKVILIHGDAGVTAVRASWFGELSLFDMVWIDDGHTYSDVVRDCLIALLFGRMFLTKEEHTPFLICGHDYERPFNDVARAVNDCFGRQTVNHGPGTIWYL